MMSRSWKGLGKDISNVGRTRGIRRQEVHWMVINWYIQKNGVDQYTNIDLDEASASIRT